MLRKFTKDVGRYKAGDVHNYSKDVWQRIAEAAAKTRRNGLRIAEEKIDLAKELDAFSVEVPDEVRNLMQASKTRMKRREQYGLSPDVPHS